MKPRVSILCITFNQKAYIAQALDSFLSQKTNFDYEILIHDDASTDGTTEIVKAYAQKYPKQIRLFTEKENQYSKHNFEFIKNLFIAAKGRYIATCEGDDYWTDENKLQIQVDFLDSHKDYALCFHVSDVVYENSTREPHKYPDVDNKKWYTLEQLFSVNYIATSSVMYRSQKYDSFISSMMPGDWYTHLFHAQFGKIKYLDRAMSVYRKHESGVFYDYDQERDKIWIKYGLDYVRFYSELIRIYGTNEHYLAQLKAILFDLMNTLIGVDNKYATHHFQDVMHENPGNLTEFLLYQHETMRTLKDEKESFRKELLQAGDERYRYEVKADEANHKYLELKDRYRVIEKELHYVKKMPFWRVRRATGHIARRVVALFAHKATDRK